MPELDGPRQPPASGRVPKQLVILCHGLGADGYDLIGLAPAWGQALPDAAFTSPSAPFPHDSGFGRQWWSVADRDPSVMEAGARRAAPYLDRFIDAELARQNLPSTAFALAGFSQGAMISLFLGLRRPTPPRAILAFSGALLAPQSLATELRNLPPVLLVHGESDDVIPVQRSHDAEATLKAAGLNVEAHYIPHLGHGIDDTGLSVGANFLRQSFAIE